MKCPACKTVDLVMSDRNGIEIDYCPQCRGVWLDRGELDKIIERSAGMMQAPAPQPAYNNPTHAHQQHNPHNQHADYRYQQSHHTEHHDHRHDNHHGYHKKRREGFFSDLFDFD